MKYVLLVVMLCLVGCQEAEKTEYEQLVEAAEMQAVKIAVIEQGIKLNHYLNQMEDPNTP
jgi:hypothetical protein